MNKDIEKIICIMFCRTNGMLILRLYHVDITKFCAMGVSLFNISLLLKVTINHLSQHWVIDDQHRALASIITYGN